MRRDVKFCPFHGPIVTRDENGNPISEPLSKGEASILMPLFGKGGEGGGDEKERKGRKSDGGARARIEDKVTPKKKGRTSV